jgi:hypothetical protein
MSTIRFKRGSGLNSDYASLSYSGDSLGNYCEPWVNTTTKQLWVDGTCINKKLVSSSTIGAGSPAIITTGSNTGTVVQDFEVILSQVSGNILEVKSDGLYATSPAAPTTLCYGQIKVKNISTDGSTISAIGANELYTFTSENEWLVLTATNSSTADLDEIKIKHKVPIASPAGTYGDATHVSKVTVDAAGHVTSAEEVAISMPSMPTATVFKGTIGDGTESPLPTITFATLPAASSSNEQWAYKLVTDKTTSTGYCPLAHAGDFIVSINLGTEQSPSYTWMVIPSGDETYTGDNSWINVSNNVVSHIGPVTTNPSSAASETGTGRTYVTDVKIDAKGHVVKVLTNTETGGSDLQTITGTVSGSTPNNNAVWTLSDNGGTVTLKHTAQNSNVGSVVNFSAVSNVITMDIAIIDGGVF